MFEVVDVVVAGDKIGNVLSIPPDSELGGFKGSIFSGGPIEVELIGSSVVENEVILINLILIRIKFHNLSVTPFAVIDLTRSDFSSVDSPVTDVAINVGPVLALGHVHESWLDSFDELIRIACDNVAWSIIYIKVRITHDNICGIHDISQV